MRHLTTENIITYLNGRAPDAEKSETEAHLAVCIVCSESRTQIRALERRLRREPCYELPPDFVAGLLNLFPAVREPEKTSFRQIVASLIYDSFDQPMLAGARRLTVAPRHLLFCAGDIDVDVKIESSGDQQMTLTGQVLSGSSRFFDNAPVTLESGGPVRYQTCTNEMGEFSIEVPNDTYRLFVDLPEGQIDITLSSRG
jgi:hypothetical protein